MTHSWDSKINDYRKIYVLLTVKKGIYILQFPAQRELAKSTFVYKNNPLPASTLLVTPANVIPP